MIAFIENLIEWPSDASGWFLLGLATIIGLILCGICLGFRLVSKDYESQENADSSSKRRK